MAVARLRYSNLRLEARCINPFILHRLSADPGLASSITKLTIRWRWSRATDDSLFLVLAHLRTLRTLSLECRVPIPQTIFMKVLLAIADVPTLEQFIVCGYCPAPLSMVFKSKCLTDVKQVFWMVWDANMELETPQVSANVVEDGHTDTAPIQNASDVTQDQTIEADDNTEPLHALNALKFETSKQISEFLSGLE